MYTNHQPPYNHPLVDRSPNIAELRKTVTIHSTDRDTSKWPNSSEFEITLPEPMDNVMYMGVMDCVLPLEIPTITEYYQNNKLLISPNYVPATNTVTSFDVLEIPQGNYTPQALAYELQYQLNKLSSVYGTNQFRTGYNKSTKKILIGNMSVGFTLLFGDFILGTATLSPADISYNLCPNQDLIASRPRYFNPLKWGLGYNLGFEKKNIVAASVGTNNQYIGSENPGINTSNGALLENNLWMLPSNGYVATPEVCLNLRNPSVIYMEIDNFNNLNELVPYQQYTSNFNNTNYSPSLVTGQTYKIANDLCDVSNCLGVADCSGTIINYNRDPKTDPSILYSSSERTAALTKINSCNNRSVSNQYGGRVKSAFCKLFVGGTPTETNLGNTNSKDSAYDYNTIFINNLEKRIFKLKLKFRWHDGTLVDFCNDEFNFTIYFGTVVNDTSPHMSTLRNPLFGAP